MKIIDENLLKKSLTDCKDLGNIDDLEDFKEKMLNIGVEIKDSDVDIIRSIFETDDREEIKLKFKELGLNLSDDDVDNVLSSLSMNEGRIENDLGLELTDESLSKINAGFSPAVCVGALVIAAGGTILTAGAYKIGKLIKKKKSKKK